MKMKSLFVLLFIFAFSAFAYSQSVTVTSKKVNYTRKKPFAEHKKSFTVNYPIIKAATPALSKKIETAISYQKVSGFNLQEELTEVQWLEEADYEVLYNKNGFMTISLWMSGSGAYPSTFRKDVVVNLKTGTVVKPADVFSNLDDLAAILKEQQIAEIEAAKKEIKADSENTDIDADELFGGKDFTAENIDEFLVSDEGVTFKYDYGFPHVIQALSPNGEYKMTWTQLKPFLIKGSVFSTFVK